jgi:methionyl aminopeptidase
MIRLKNAQQIAKIRESCKLLSAMYRELIPLVVPGITGTEIDRWVAAWIKKAGGRPAFYHYTPTRTMPPFPGSI